MRVFSYKIARDYGFAPNPFHGVCTLATCKPQIRSAAKIGDIVVGCGSTSNSLPGRVIFAMRVEGKSRFQEYWDDDQFVKKRPSFRGNRKSAYGDNLYHHDIHGEWIQERSHHSFADGSLNESNLSTDIGSDNVLWSHDFVYYGREAPLIPARLRAFAGDDLYPNGRSYRVNFPAGMPEAVEEWFDAIKDRGYRGRPAAWR
ncbi:MAG: hypothetical protein EOO82_00020 [Oxalobacteraceae bacterium]|nr:MAG: hypothetical protein EOO82_00020 [Oxalobacteraceae bacterium]